MSAFLNHEENLAFLREGKGGLTLGGSYYATEEQYRQAHGLDIPEADASAKLSSSFAESEPSHETTITLLPGVAVYRPDGLPPVTIEGGGGLAAWYAPGDFQRYLQPGEPETETSGLVREILVGSYRNPADDDNDDPAYLGTFVPDSEWDAVVGDVHRGYLQLVEEIGFDPAVERPDESKPRGESWLAERAHWEAETAKWEADFVGLKNQVRELEAKLAAQPVAIDTPSRAALPENALELIKQAGRVGQDRAEAIFAALQPDPATPSETPEPAQTPEPAES